MLRKPIKYVDYDGVEKEEMFYFNLTKAEILKMEMSVQGGLSGMIEDVIAAKNPDQIIKILEDFVLKAYGEKSPDGKRFIKSEELSSDFSHTEAYSNLFMELATDAEAAAEFINTLIPADIVREVQKPVGIQGN